MLDECHHLLEVWGRLLAELLGDLPDARVPSVALPATDGERVDLAAAAAGDGFLHRLFLDAAGISVLDMWPDGGVAVRTVNDTAHLAAL